jgi:acyl-CoA reductase-like NAD-dependent aldehyde dehydrogenase
VDEEQFGIALIIKYSKVDDAIAQANATHYGLGGSIWTNDLDGHALAQELDSGTAWVNHHGHHPFAPFGAKVERHRPREHAGATGRSRDQVVNTKKG